MRPLIGLTLLFTACAPSREGESCENDGNFECDAGGQLWYCDAGTWTTEQPTDSGAEHCSCDGAAMQCAIPGFVGLDRAGRARRAVRRLRRVA